MEWNTDSGCGPFFYNVFFYGVRHRDEERTNEKAIKGESVKISFKLMRKIITEIEENIKYQKPFIMTMQDSV